LTLPAAQGGRALDASARARTAAGRLPAAVILLGIVVMSATLRLVVAAQSAAPWIVPDELVYSHLARSFAATGHFAIRGQPFSAWSFGPLYPVVISPLYRIADPMTAYFLVKLLNCLLFSLAAVPAYLLARRFLTRQRALILSALAVFIPSAVYTSKVMTESLAYPLFLLAVLGIVRALDSPSHSREASAVAAIAMATLARGQLIVLLPAFGLTAVILAVLDERDAGSGRDLRKILRRLAVHRVVWISSIALAASLLATSLLGLSGEVAGGHGEAFAGVSAVQLLESIAFHIAQLDLYLGVLPFAAMTVICAFAFRRGSGDRSLRILCALTITTTALLAAAAARYLLAVYATAPDPYIRVYDRYEFYVVPLFLIVFFVWLQRDLPRPGGKVTPLIGIAAGGLIAILPYAHLLNGREWGTSSSSVALVPLAIVRQLTGTTVAVYAVVLVGAACLAHAFAYSTNARSLLLLIVVSFAVLNLSVQAGNSGVSQRALRAGIGNQTARDWVDQAVGGRGQVAAIWSGVRGRGWKGWYTIWENEFFNASVGKVYDLREPMRYKLPSVQLHRSGLALFLPNGNKFVAKYVLTDMRTPVIGVRIATDAATGMVLYRVDGPVRLR